MNSQDIKKSLTMYYVTNTIKKIVLVQLSISYRYIISNKHHYIKKTVSAKDIIKVYRIYR